MNNKIYLDFSSVASRSSFQFSPHRLILPRIIRLNRLTLDNHRRIATRQRLAFGRYRPRDIARGQSQRHRHSRRNRQCQILNRLHKALFLNVS